MIVVVFYLLALFGVVLAGYGFWVGKPQVENGVHLIIGLLFLILAELEEKRE